MAKVWQLLSGAGEAVAVKQLPPKIVVSSLPPTIEPFTLKVTFMDGNVEELTAGWYEQWAGALKAFTGYIPVAQNERIGWREICAWPLQHIRKWEIIR